MDSVEKKAYAKINLTLDVIGKYDNGYHELKMIMQSISMHDNLVVSKMDQKGVLINCNKNIAELKDNIIYKACMLMIDRFNIKEGIRVDLEKNIFVAAGLAGGSTDCAQTIIGINELFSLGLNKEEMKKIGAELGKDVVYCINGGLCVATGDGTELEEINGFKETCVLVANPGFGVSTKKVFENYEFIEYKQSDYNGMLKSIELGDVEGICNNFNNMLESVTINMYPIIGEIKQSMNDNGAIGSLMSGSGATVFGFFKTEGDAMLAKNKLINNFSDIKVQVCYTI